MLQTIFGENVLNSNEFRNKMVSYKELIVFLLSEVVVKLFDVRNNARSQSNNHNLSFANQLKKI